MMKSRLQYVKSHSKRPRKALTKRAGPHLFPSASLLFSKTKELVAWSPAPTQLNASTRESVERRDAVRPATSTFTPWPMYYTGLAQLAARAATATTITPPTPNPHMRLLQRRSCTGAVFSCSAKVRSSESKSAVALLLRTLPAPPFW